MFDKLFMMAGPVWSVVALLALLVAYFALVASETARMARQEGQDELEFGAWTRGRLDSLRARFPWPPTGRRGPPLDSSPHNSSP